VPEMLTQFADRHFQRFHQLNRWIGFVNQTLEGHADRFRVGIFFNGSNHTFAVNTLPVSSGF
jgi:hypothetical protein